MAIETRISAPITDRCSVNVWKLFTFCGPSGIAQKLWMSRMVRKVKTPSIPAPSHTYRPQITSAEPMSWVAAVAITTSSCCEKPSDLMISTLSPKFTRKPSPAPQNMKVSNTRVKMATARASRMAATKPGVM